jgi:hypothetical protein
MTRGSAALLVGGAVAGGILLTGGVVRGAAGQPTGGAGATIAAAHTGSGMMGGYGGFGMMGSRQQSHATGTLTINDAQHRVEVYIKQYGNPHLVIDEIMEFQRNFYAIVKDTNTGHGAFEVLVNKWPGLVFPEYGPAMMWNTLYGMMRGGMGYRNPSGSMTISPAGAARIARQWLARNRPGATPEAPDQLPGYYTVHFRTSGTIAGMLSINGYSGQVWYHTWHGKFIRMKTVNG